MKSIKNISKKSPLSFLALKADKRSSEAIVSFRGFFAGVNNWSKRRSAGSVAKSDGESTNQLVSVAKSGGESTDQLVSVAKSGGESANQLRSVAKSGGESADQLASVTFFKCSPLTPLSLLFQIFKMVSLIFKPIWKQ